MLGIITNLPESITISLSFNLTIAYGRARPHHQTGDIIFFNGKRRRHVLKIKSVSPNIGHIFLMATYWQLRLPLHPR